MHNILLMRHPRCTLDLCRTKRERGSERVRRYDANVEVMTGKSDMKEGRKK